MKPTKLTIKNIGCIKYVEIPLNTPMVKLYGEIQNGKTTILNAVKWVTGSKLPTDLIRHGESEASIRIDYEKGDYIERSFYINSKNETKARPVTFIKDGVAVEKPSDVLKKLSGGFMADQDAFNKLSIDDKKKYFTNILGLDTEAEDSKIDEVVRAAKDLRKKIKDVGKVVVPEPMEEPQKPTELLNLRKEIEERNAAKTTKYVSLIRSREDVVSAKAKIDAERELKQKRLEELKAQFLSIKEEGERIKAELAADQEDYELGAVEEPELESTDEIDEKINTISEQAQKYEEYLNLKRLAEEVEQQKAELKELEKNKKLAEKQKADKLIALNGSHGIDGLVFHGDGTITYKDTALDMLSTSQQFNLSYELAMKQSNELGILPIDRAESLGRSIDDYVKHAVSNNLTVLATIVGSYPAESTEEKGVFVVSHGTVHEPSTSIPSSEEKEVASVEQEVPAAEATSPVSEDVETPEAIEITLESLNGDFARKVAMEKPNLIVFFLMAKKFDEVDGVLELTFAPEHEFQAGEVTKPANIGFMENEIHKFYGKKLALNVIVEEEVTPTDEPKSEESVEGTEQEKNDFDFGDAEW